MNRLRKIRFCIVVLLVLAVTYGAYYAWVEVRLRKELRLFRETGFPMNQDELRTMRLTAYGDVPTGPDNGAAILEQAFALYPAPLLSPAWAPSTARCTAEFPRLSHLTPGAAQEALDELVSAYGNALPLLHEGARKPIIRFAPRPATPPREGYDLSWYLEPLETGIETLLLQAQYAAACGDSQQATDAMVVAMALVKGLENDFSGVAPRVRRECHDDWMRVLGAVLGYHVLALDHLEALAVALGDPSKPDLWPSPHIGDGRAVQWALSTSWADVREAVDNGEFSNVQPRGAVGDVVSAAFLVVFVPARLHCLDAIEYMQTARFLDRAGRDPVLRDKWATGYELAQARERGLPRSHRVTRSLLARYASDSLSLEEDAAKSLLPHARTALAIEAYRATNGSLPASLDALVPEYLDAVPTDPMWLPDGPEPVRYVAGADGYTVCGVGLNGQDDGGDPAPDGSLGTMDICFTVGERERAP